MSKNKKRGDRTVRDLRRPRGKSSSKCTLIVTEGEKTEPNYLKALQRRLGLKATRIEVVHPEGTDPITLIHAAIKLRDNRKRDSKKSNTMIPYDEIWVVFDLEKTHDERRQQAKAARQLKGARGIKFVESDPSFEFWRLLHEIYTAQGFESGSAVLKKLKQTVPSYTKSEIPSAETLNKIPTAVKRAQRLRKDNQKTGRTNPSTNVDLLVRSMNEAARPTSQFSLPTED